MADRYVLACFICSTLCLAAGQSPKYALKGEMVVLKPNIAGRPETILWKHRGDKVVEFNGQEQDVYRTYQDRVTLDWVSAEVSITDLRLEDSGDYVLDVEINKRLVHSRHTLAVIEKVAKPTISCEMSNGSSSDVSGKLSCSAEPRRPESLVTSEWRSHGDVQPGPQLLISLGDGHDDKVYTCNVSNPLSSETASFTAKDCYPEQSSSVATVAVLVTFFIVFILVGLAVLFCKLRRKACFAKKDLETMSRPAATEGHVRRTTKRFEENNAAQISQGSERKRAPGEENRPLLHGGVDEDRRNMSPNEAAGSHRGDTDSDHDAVKAHDLTFEDDTPKKGHVGRTTKRFEENNAAQISQDQRREPAEEKAPRSDASSDSKTNEPDPAGVEPQSDLKFPIAPEQPEPEKRADEDEEAPSAPAGAEPSPAAQQPHSPLTGSSPNIAPEDSAGAHEEVTDQVTAENDGGESDSFDEGERNESDDSGDDELPYTVPEQKGSKISLDGQNDKLSEGETNSSEEKQQETVKPVSEDETGSVGDREEDTERDLCLATSQQTQSSTPTTPDDRISDAVEESPESPSRDSDERAGQSDGGESETAGDKSEVQRVPEEDEPGSKSEDEDGRRKDKAVA